MGRAPERATHQCNHSIFDVFRRERHLDSSPTDDVTESSSSLSEASLGDTEVVYATWVCEDTVRYCLRFAPSLVRIHGKCQDAAVSYGSTGHGVSCRHRCRISHLSRRFASSAESVEIELNAKDGLSPPCRGSEYVNLTQEHPRHILGPAGGLLHGNTGSSH